MLVLEIILQTNLAKVGFMAVFFSDRSFLNELGSPPRKRTGLRPQVLCPVSHGASVELSRRSLHVNAQVLLPFEGLVRSASSAQ